VLALKTWLEEQLAHVSGKSIIAEAIRYGLNHWDGLVRFLADGRIELDTNIVERGMRSSPGTMGVQRTGLVLLRSSRPANCTPSIRKPTSPRFSPSSSISGPNRVSTSSCPGPGQQVAQPIGSPREPHGLHPSRRTRLTKKQALKVVGSEKR
jgi:hypothetical protein